MRTFKDCEGRTWSVTLNVLQMKRIRANLGVDLVNVIALDSGGKVKVDLVDRIANDPCLLVDILWVCVEEEAKAAGVTDEQFGRSLAGDAIEDATRAFLDELVDFFPGAKRLFASRSRCARLRVRRHPRSEPRSLHPARARVDGGGARQVRVEPDCLADGAGGQPDAGPEERQGGKPGGLQSVRAQAARAGSQGKGNARGSQGRVHQGEEEVAGCLQTPTYAPDAPTWR